MNANLVSKSFFTCLKGTLKKGIWTEKKCTVISLVYPNVIVNCFNNWWDVLQIHSNPGFIYSSQTFLRSPNYSFIPFSSLILIFVYVFAAQTSASPAGPKFKTVRQKIWKNNYRDLRRSGYFTTCMKPLWVAHIKQQILRKSSLHEKLQKKSQHDNKVVNQLAHCLPKKWTQFFFTPE